MRRLPTTYSANIAKTTSAKLTCSVTSVLLCRAWGRVRTYIAALWRDGALVLSYRGTFSRDRRPRREPVRFARLFCVSGRLANTVTGSRRLKLELSPGIGPGSSRWERDTLPLSYDSVAMRGSRTHYLQLMRLVWYGPCETFRSTRPHWFRTVLDRSSWIRRRLSDRSVSSRGDVR